MLKHLKIGDSGQNLSTNHKYQVEYVSCPAFYLHIVRNFLTVREDLCQVLGAQDVPQGGLGQQPGGSISIVDVSHSQNSVVNPVVDHTIDADGHRVLGQNLWEGRPW